MMPASTLARAWPALVALPRGPGCSEGAVAHKDNPPLLRGGEVGGWNRGARLLALWARRRRRRVCVCVWGVRGRWAIDELGPGAPGMRWRGAHRPPAPFWPRRGPAIGQGTQRGPATW